MGKLCCIHFKPAPAAPSFVQNAFRAARVQRLVRKQRVPALLARLAAILSGSTRFLLITRNRDKRALPPARSYSQTQPAPCVHARLRSLCSCMFAMTQYVACIHTICVSPRRSLATPSAAATPLSMAACTVMHASLLYASPANCTLPPPSSLASSSASACVHPTLQ